MRRLGLDIVRLVDGSFSVALFTAEPTAGSESTMFGEHFTLVASLAYRGSDVAGARAAAIAAGFAVSQ